MVLQTGEVTVAAWVRSVVPVRGTWADLEAVSGDAPYILEPEDFSESVVWASADLPIGDIRTSPCLESPQDYQERMDAIRSVPFGQLYRIIVELRPDGSLVLLDGGHRVDRAREVGVDVCPSLLKCDRAALDAAFRREGVVPPVFPPPAFDGEGGDDETDQRAPSNGPRDAAA